VQHHAETNPARRNGQPEDVAEAVLYALTNTFVTGTR
jgi:NAD(P)-dependent dehydrogenase (short-subunit alcohol dehydrogenase family)